MKTQIDKWGNSLAIRIPTALAREIAARKGLEVNLSIEDGRLVITPLAPKSGYTLEEILRGLDENEPQGEIEWGPPVGDEAW